MRIAVVGDIHSNLVALQAVLGEIERWHPEHVVVVGDVVNRGPRPLECWELVAERVATAGWSLIIGNHEEYVLQVAANPAQPGSPAHQVHRHTHWTWQQLTGRETPLVAMRGLARTLHLATAAGPVAATHGSLLGTRDGIYPHTAGDELRAKIDPQSSVFCVGHTHRPLLRRSDTTLVVNAGSVGMPFDRDRRTGYVRLEARRDGWHGELVRLSYDWAAARAEFQTSGFMDGSGPLGRVVVKEFEHARPYLASWTARFQRAVLAGQLSMDEAVSRFLTGIGAGEC